MSMKRYILLATATIAVTAASSVAIVRSTTQDQPTGAVGRYQVATAYRDAGNWVFVTVIDTSSGQIVKQERYSGFKQYTEMK